jgi:hypothetical protein
VESKLEGFLTTIAMSGGQVPKQGMEIGGNRDRMCTLRLWSTGRSVQDRLKLSNTGLNSLILATHRPAASKNV